MYLRDTTSRDLETFKPSLEDILEAGAAGINPTIDSPEGCVTMDREGEPLAIGGAEGSQCWFITSRSVPGLSRLERKRFIELISEYRDLMLTRHEVLWNYVWIGNKSHIRFLKAIGAVFHNEFAHDGKFQLFTIRRP